MASNRPIEDRARVRAACWPTPTCFVTARSGRPVVGFARLADRFSDSACYLSDLAVDQGPARARVSAKRLIEETRAARRRELDHDLAACPAPTAVELLQGYQDAPGRQLLPLPANPVIGHPPRSFPIRNAANGTPRSTSGPAPEGRDGRTTPSPCPTTHAVVWLDFHQAKIFLIQAEDIEAPAHRGRHAASPDSTTRRRSGARRTCGATTGPISRAILAAVEEADSWLIAGPLAGPRRTSRKYLEGHGRGAEEEAGGSRKSMDHPNRGRVDQAGPATLFEPTTA